MFKNVVPARAACSGSVWLLISPFGQYSEPMPRIHTDAYVFAPLFSFVSIVCSIVYICNERVKIYVHFMYLSGRVCFEQRCELLAQYDTKYTNCVEQTQCEGNRFFANCPTHKSFDFPGDMIRPTTFNQCPNVRMCAMQRVLHIPE